jgi:hypothetical protein
MRSRPDLIIPIRDRRQRRRILTLKNFYKAAIVAIVLFAGLTIYSDIRHPHSNGDYGRLFGKQVSGQVPEVKKPPVDVVKEAPVPDQTAADPLLVAAQAREQYLGNPTLTPAPVAANVPPPPPPVTNSDGSAVVGGPNGVTIVKGKTNTKPTLQGGIFRQ